MPQPIEEKLVALPTLTCPIVCTRTYAHSSSGPINAGIADATVISCLYLTSCDLIPPAQLCQCRRSCRVLHSRRARVRLPAVVPPAAQGHCTTKPAWTN